MMKSGPSLCNGLNAPTIRGINYQPAAFFGRIDEALTESTEELPKTRDLKRGPQPFGKTDGPYLEAI